MRSSFRVVFASAAVLAATVQPSVGVEHPRPHNGVGVLMPNQRHLTQVTHAGGGVEMDGLRTTITFDTGTAPCVFQHTQALEDEYASVGVHFRGPAAMEGGAILNRCAHFGIGARSGREFLAFNGDTYAKVPETVTFDSPVRRVACYVADGDPGGEATYWLLAKRDGQLVAKTKVVVQSLAYTGLQVRAKQGIDTVVIKASTTDHTSFVLDDLSFVPLL